METDSLVVGEVISLAIAFVAARLPDPCDATYTEAEKLLSRLIAARYIVLSQ